MSTHEIPAYRMTGPSAVAGGFQRLAHLSGLLALTEFRLRFFGSALGYLWTLMRPLLLFGVLYAVFSEVLRLGDSVRFYGVMLLANIVLYEYFSEATATAVPSVVDRESFVRKVHFPRMAIPLSVTLTAALNLVLNFVAVFVFIAIAGVSVQWTWLELPFLLLALIAFAIGVAMLLSALYVRFRDVKPIWEIFLRALFYATPVLYPIEQLADRSETLAKIVLCNPLAAIIVQVRHAVVDPTAPSAAEAIGSTAGLLVPVAVLVGTCALGVWFFNREAPRIAEEL